MINETNNQPTLNDDNPKPESKLKTFFSVNKEFRLGADKIRSEKRFPSGQIDQSSAVITFVDHIYQTENKKEIEIIKNCSDFELGRVKEITSEDLSTHIANTIIVKPTDVSE